MLRQVWVAFKANLLAVERGYADCDLYPPRIYLRGGSCAQTRVEFKLTNKESKQTGSS